MDSVADHSGYIGVGVVAENSILGREEEIHVFLQDTFPNARGKLELNPQEFKTKGVDSRGKSYNQKVLSSSTVTCYWLSENSNRITPPQVMKGETVSVYRFNGSDKLYWKPLNQHMNRRVQETVVEAYAAKPLEAGKNPVESTPENSYSRTVDTVNGIIEMRMSKANGEMSAWVLQMNGKSGILTLSDQQGNVIQIDTGKTCIDIKNKDGSHIQLDKQVINIHADKEINMSTETWNVECQTYNLKADKVSWNVGSQVSMGIGSSMDVNCPTINLVGVVNVGTLNVTGSAGSGNAAIKGNMEMQGNAQITGSTNVGGSLSASGPVNFPAGGTIAGYD